MVSNILKNWEKEHFRKILLELKLELKKTEIDFSLDNLDEIIKQTSFEVRSRNYSHECPYYVSNKKCHDLEDLNCFLCACPNYNSGSLIGGCEIESKSGKWHYHKNLPKGKVWDCFDCSVNHSSGEVRDYIEKNFDKLKEIFDSL
tara:strand:+ start:672 stop:1106 length:435 start_codon:yes stop_codon:yes gene_type:complete